MTNWEIYAEDYKSLQLEVYKSDGIIPRENKFFFYYDESDNIRKFTIKNKGFNSDIFTQFTLGGIVGEFEISDNLLNNLFDMLNLQPTIIELKSKHIFNNRASDSILNKFQSKNLKIILEYLIESNYYLHYIVINVFYFGIVVEIVDFLLESEYERIPKKIIDRLKSIVYFSMILEKEKWLDLLVKYKYPNLSQIGMKKILEELEKSIINIKNSSNLIECNYILVYIRMYLWFKNFDFTKNYNEDDIIHDFSFVYKHNIFIYDNSYHLFDNEDIIQKIFERIKLNECNLSSRFSFEDSKKRKVLQVSDVCMATISLLYKFFSKNTVFSLEKYFNNLNKEDYIYKNLKLLSLLIRKTINYDPCFITQMSNSIEIEKYHFFIDYFKKTDS